MVTKQCVGLHTNLIHYLCFIIQQINENVKPYVMLQSLHHTWKSNDFYISNQYDSRITMEGWVMPRHTSDTQFVIKFKLTI